MVANHLDMGIEEHSRDRAGARRPGFGLPVRILREPLLHFILLGAAIFIGGHYLDERARFMQITITQDQIRHLADNYRLQYGRVPSPEQLEALVHGVIKEEIFYREALKLGLEANDEIIRRRLVQKYEFLQQDLAIPAEPAEAQLRAYYRQHLDRYRRPQTVTFTHVYFSPDVRGEERAHMAAQELAADLNRQGLSRVVDRGDRFPGSYDFTAAAPEVLARVFGRDGLAETIFSVEPKRWSGPLRSGLGWHVVYVNAHEPPRQIPYGEVQKEVLRDYLDAERDRHNAEALAKLRRQFRIVRE